MSMEGPCLSALRRGSRAELHRGNLDSEADGNQTVAQPGVVLPDRISGAGHGAGLLNRLDSNVNRHSWWNTRMSNQSSENKRTTVDFEAFPRPPRNGASREATVPISNPMVPFVRALSGNSPQSLSFEQQRQKWYTERARARLEGAARFSNAGSFGMTSSTRPMWIGKNKRVTGEFIRSATVAEDTEDVDDNGPGVHSWSKWSGIGPAVRDFQGAGNPLDTCTGNVPNSRTNDSMGSSRQFESVSSSGSEWEDENGVEEAEKGGSPWRPDGSVSSSPCLAPCLRENVRSGNATTGTWQVRAADGRKHVGVEESGLKEAQDGRQASFRFI